MFSTTRTSVNTTATAGASVSAAKSTARRKSGGGGVASSSARQQPPPPPPDASYSSLAEDSPAGVFNFTAFETTDALEEREARQRATEEKELRRRQQQQQGADNKGGGKGARYKESAGGANTAPAGEDDGRLNSPHRKSQQQQHGTDADQQQQQQAIAAAEAHHRMISSMSRAHGGDALPIYRDHEHGGGDTNNNTTTTMQQQPGGGLFHVVGQSVADRRGVTNQQQPQHPNNNNNGANQQQQYQLDPATAAHDAQVREAHRLALEEEKQRANKKNSLLYKAKKLQKKLFKRITAFLFYLHFGDRAKERQFVVFNNQNDIEGTVGMILSIGGSLFYYLNSYYDPQKWSFLFLMPLEGVVILIRISFIIYGRLRLSQLQKALLEAERDELLEADPQSLSEALRIAAAAAEDPLERERNAKKKLAVNKSLETAQERRARRRRKQLEKDSPTPAQLKREADSLQYFVAMWNERLVHIFIALNNIVCFVSYPNIQYCVLANDPIPDRDCTYSFWIWPGVYAVMLLYLFVSLPRLMPITWFLVLSHTVLYIVGRWLDPWESDNTVYLAQSLLGACICAVALTFLMKSEEMRREMFVAIARVERYKLQTHELQGRLVRHTAACVSKPLARQLIAARGSNCPVTAEGTIVTVRLAKFTEWCSRNSGREISFHLKSVFSACDRAVLKSNVHHLTTFGDLYVVVSGLDGTLTPTESAECGCVFAAAILTNREGTLRVSIASGPIKGVISSNPVMYQLFGNTSADTSALTSNEKPDVTLCAVTKKLLGGAATLDEVIANIRARDEAAGLYVPPPPAPQRRGFNKPSSSSQQQGNGTNGASTTVVGFGNRSVGDNNNNASSSTANPHNNNNTQQQQGNGNTNNNSNSNAAGMLSTSAAVAAGGAGGGVGGKNLSINTASDQQLPPPALSAFRSGSHLDTGGGGGGGGLSSSNQNASATFDLVGGGTQTNNASSGVRVSIPTAVVSGNDVSLSSPNPSTHHNHHSGGIGGGGVGNRSGSNTNIKSASLTPNATTNALPTPPHGHGHGRPSTTTAANTATHAAAGSRHNTNTTAATSAAANPPAQKCQSGGGGGVAGGANRLGGVGVSRHAAAKNLYDTDAPNVTRDLFRQLSGERYYVYTDLQTRLAEARSSHFRTRWQLSLKFKDKEIEDCFVRDVSIRVASSSAVVAGSFFFAGLSIGCLVLLFIDIRPYEFRPATTFSAAMFTMSTFGSSFMFYCVRRLRIDHALLMYFGLMMVWQCGLAASPPGMLTNNMQVWSMVLYLIAYMLLPPGVINTIWWATANGLLVAVPISIMTVFLDTFAIPSTIFYHFATLFFLAYMHLTQEYSARGRFLDMIYSYFLAKSLQAETLVLHQQLQIPTQALTLLNEATTVTIPKLNKDDTDPLNMYGGGGRLRVLDLELDDPPEVQQGVDETAIFVMQLMDSRAAAAALGRRLKVEPGVVQSAYLMRLCYAVCDDAIAKYGEGCVFRAKQHNGMVVLATLRDSVPAVGHLANVVQNIYVRVHELKKDIVMTCTLAAGNLAAAILGDDFLSFDMYGDTLQTAMRVVNAAPPGSLTCSDRFFFIYECWQEEMLIAYEEYYAALEMERLAMEAANGERNGNAEMGGGEAEGDHFALDTNAVMAGGDGDDDHQHAVEMQQPHHQQQQGLGMSYSLPQQQASPSAPLAMPNASSRRLPPSRAAHTNNSTTRYLQAPAGGGGGVGATASPNGTVSGLPNAAEGGGGSVFNNNHSVNNIQGNHTVSQRAFNPMAASQSQSQQQQQAQMSLRRRQQQKAMANAAGATLSMSAAVQRRSSLLATAGGGVGGAAGGGGGGGGGAHRLPPIHHGTNAPQQSGGGAGGGDRSGVGLSSTVGVLGAADTAAARINNPSASQSVKAAGSSMSASYAQRRMEQQRRRPKIGGAGGGGGNSGGIELPPGGFKNPSPSSVLPSSAFPPPSSSSPAAGSGAADGGAYASPGIVTSSSGEAAGADGAAPTPMTEPHQSSHIAGGGGGGTAAEGNISAFAGAAAAQTSDHHQQPTDPAGADGAHHGEEGPAADEQQQDGEEEEGGGPFYEEFSSPFEIHDPLPWKLRGRGVVAIRYVSVYSYETKEE